MRRLARGRASTISMYVCRKVKAKLFLPPSSTPPRLPQTAQDELLRCQSARDMTGCGLKLGCSTVRMGGVELDGGQPGRLLWRTGPPPSTVPHPTASMKVTNGAALAAASTHDTQTHHLPPTLYVEPFHPCNICTGVPPTLKRPAPTRVVLWETHKRPIHPLGAAACVRGGHPRQAASRCRTRRWPSWYLDRDQGATAYLVGRGAEGPSWGRL